MSFVVYEEDPLVRYDIIETLMSEFEGFSVVPAQSIEGLAEESVCPEKEKVLIVSLPDGAAQADLDHMTRASRKAGVVVISNAQDGHYRLPQNCYFIQRPFGSDLLIKAVRSVLSDPPAPLS